MHLPVNFTALPFFAAIVLAATTVEAQSPAVRRAPSVQRANALCFQADEEQHNDHLPEARAHLEEALAALGALDTLPARRARVTCASTLALVLAAQGDRRGAWARTLEAWGAARNLPPVERARQEVGFFDLARQVWSGPRCVEGIDPSALDETEVYALQSLARFNTPDVAVCLGAIRQRLAREQRGTCRAISTLPEGVTAYTPNATGWTRVDAQTGVGGDGESVYVARIVGGSTRYTRCDTGLSEAQLERVSGEWSLPGAAFTVTARIRPCGEDMDPRRCPAETLAYVLDGEGTLLGHYALQRSPHSDRGPLAQPFGPVAAASAFRAEGSNLRAGTRLLRVVGGALVNTQ